MVLAAFLAPLNGDLVSPSWASGGPWVRRKRKGGRSLRFASRTVVPRCWVTVLGRWMPHAECYHLSTG